MKSPPECKLRGVSNVLWLLMATGLMVLRPEAGEAKAATHAAPLRQDARVAAQPDVAYHYRPFRMHDPFRPFLKREKASIRKPARRTTGIPPRPDVLSPLQEAAVTQYKLRAVGGDAFHRTAIVEDMNGRFYPVVVGTILGMRQGRVVDIQQDRLVVEEMVPGKGGQTKREQITLRLPREF